MNDPLAPLALQPDGLETLIRHNLAHDPGFADVWSPYAHMIKLADERSRLGLTQADVAARMGVSQSIVARMEREPSGVTFARILAYARAVGAEIVVRPGKEKPKGARPRKVAACSSAWSCAAPPPSSSAKGSP